MRPSPLMQFKSLFAAAWPGEQERALLLISLQVRPLGASQNDGTEARGVYLSPPPHTLHHGPINCTACPSPCTRAGALLPHVSVAANAGCSGRAVRQGGSCASLGRVLHAGAGTQARLFCSLRVMRSPSKSPCPRPHAPLLPQLADLLTDAGFAIDTPDVAAFMSDYCAAAPPAPPGAPNSSPAASGASPQKLSAPVNPTAGVPPTPAAAPASPILVSRSEFSDLAVFAAAGAQVREFGSFCVGGRS